MKNMSLQQHDSTVYRLSRTGKGREEKGKKGKGGRKCMGKRGKKERQEV